MSWKFRPKAVSKGSSTEGDRKVEKKESDERRV